jgi:hypothetical protein
MITLNFNTPFGMTIIVKMAGMSLRLVPQILRGNSGYLEKLPQIDRIMVLYVGRLPIYLIWIVLFLLIRDQVAKKSPITYSKVASIALLLDALEIVTAPYLLSMYDLGIIPKAGNNIFSYDFTDVCMMVSGSLLFTFMYLRFVERRFWSNNTVES